MICLIDACTMHCVWIDCPAIARVFPRRKKKVKVKDKVG